MKSLFLKIVVAFAAIVGLVGAWAALTPHGAIGS
jgi:hypothetical protein